MLVLDFRDAPAENSRIPSACLGFFGAIPRNFEEYLVLVPPNHGPPTGQNRRGLKKKKKTGPAAGYCRCSTFSSQWRLRTWRTACGLLRRAETPLSKHRDFRIFAFCILLYFYPLIFCFAIFVFIFMCLFFMLRFAFSCSFFMHMFIFILF